MTQLRTPGPLTAEPIPLCVIETTEGATHRIVALTEDGADIRTVALLGGDCAAGNSQLFAAAGDMLAALQGVLRVADRATDEFDAARAAIAKATGGAS